jgi:hypothetical protein
MVADPTSGVLPEMHADPSGLSNTILDGNAPISPPPYIIGQFTSILPVPGGRRRILSVDAVSVGSQNTSLGKKNTPIVNSIYYWSIHLHDGGPGQRSIP